MGYPTHDVNFTFEFELKHEGAHNFRLHYEWLDFTAEDQVSMKETVTAPFKEWQLI